MMATLRFLGAALLAHVIAGPAPLGAQTNTPTRALGEWHGAITIPTGPLMLFVRIRETTAAVSLTGDLESVSQDGRKLPLADIVASSTTLSFAIPAINATYTGEWNDVEQAWSGSFRQGGALPLVLRRGAPPAGPVIAGLDGTWRGSLRREATTLRLVLRVRTPEPPSRGTIVALDSPDLGAMALVVEDFRRSGDTVRFAVPVSQATFVGTLRDGDRALQGTWTRPDQPDVAVTFVRDSVAMARVRTQWPITIQGYRAEEVSFENASARGVTLAGTLTVPDGAGPFPAVVLISGSGPQDRDETIFGHRPFAVLADHFSRRGIAVLRYDDRGFARSTGDHATATSADFATDANAAVRYLRTRRDIAPGAIGLVGHSEGGLIAPIAAADNDAVAFVILLAGPGTATEQLMLSQRRMIGASQGMSSAALDRAEPVMRDLYRTVRAAPDSQQAVARLRTALTPEALGALGAAEAQRELVVTQLTGPWMRYFLRYDPARYLPRLRVPVLAVNGTLDVQVPAAENLAGMRRLLAGNGDATVLELPGLNHFFQTARTGAVGEYESIAETFAPGAMDLLVDWIMARFGS